MPRSWLGDSHREGRASPLLLALPLLSSPRAAATLGSFQLQQLRAFHALGFFCWAEKTKKRIFPSLTWFFSPFSLSPLHPAEPRTSPEPRGRKREENPTATNPQHAPFLLPFDMQPALGWDKLGCSCSFGENWGKLGIFAVMTVELSSWSRVLLLSVGLLTVSVTGK